MRVREATALVDSRSRFVRRVDEIGCLESLTTKLRELLRFVDSHQESLGLGEMSLLR